MKAPIKDQQPILEAFLRENAARGVIDYHVRASVDGEGVSFYMHAQGADSDTLDFDVMGDRVVTCNQLSALLKAALYDPEAIPQ